VIHLRIVAPREKSERALELLLASDSVLNVIRLPDAARKPDGDVIMCDVAREDASVILSDLRDLEIAVDGSIAVETIDTSISDAADRAERAASGVPSDAVVWEEVEARTSENTEMSFNFLAFMVIAMLIGACGIILDSPILIIGAMVVGPEFGPIAGVCVAAVQRRGDLARRSVKALAVGFPLGIIVTYAVALLLKAVDLVPEGFASDEHPLTQFISHPDFFSILVAMLAGTAGVLSLTAAKSGALIGVLISVTTIPAAANVAVAAAFRDWQELGGAAAQLSINLVAILLAGITTLFLQRRLFDRRRRRHEQALEHEVAGLAGSGARPGVPAAGTGARPRSAAEPTSGTPRR
jgi:uncharacterized hydrophobic protein (TIGR00271 family)